VIIRFIRETFKETAQRLFGALFEGIEHLTKEIVRRFLMATRGRVSKSFLIKLLKRYIHVEAVAKTARSIVVISHPFLNKLSLLWWGTPVVYFTPRIPKINIILMHFIDHRVESIARPKTPGKLSNIHFIISFLRFIDLLKKDMRFRIKTIISVLITATIGLVIGVIVLEPFLESMLSPLLGFNFFPLIGLIVDFWVLFLIGMFLDHVIVGEVKSVTFSLEHDRRTGLLRSQIKTKRNELKEKMDKEENEKRKSKYSAKIISLDEMEREIDNLEDSRRCYYDGREYYLLFTEEGYRKAYSKYNEALEKDSRNALAYAGLGETFAFCGKLKEERGEEPTGLYNKSLESCTQAFKINKNLCEVHRAMARILWAQKKIREAEKEIKKALKINPWDAESYHVKALCKYLDADKLKLYEKALELNPNLIIAHRDLGIFYLKQFELDKAKEHFTKIIELNPNDSHAHDSIRAIASLRSINSPHLLPTFGAKY
jgi:tetratricopeptide (TPR) repeat protein